MASYKKDTNLIADIKILHALMGYMTGDAYAALNGSDELASDLLRL